MKYIIEDLPKKEHFEIFERILDIVKKSSNETELRKELKETENLHNLRMKWDYLNYDFDYQISTDDVKYGFGHNHFWAAENSTERRIIFVDFNE